MSTIIDKMLSCCCFALLVSVAHKISAHELKAEGNLTKVSCPNNPEYGPTSDIEATINPGWNNNNIYSVDVCAKLNGTIETCLASYYNSLYLHLFFPPGVWETISRSYPLGSDLLDCYTFDVKQIAKAAKGRNLTGVTIGASVKIAGNDVSENDQPEVAFQVLLRAMSYNATEDASTIFFKKGHRIHSVRAAVSDCSFGASPQDMAIDIQYRFSAAENGAPSYVNDSVTLKDKQFEVTDFQCTIKCDDVNHCAPACPVSFTRTCKQTKTGAAAAAAPPAAFGLGAILVILASISAI